ncbi:hypothetical protein F511_01150 [Dorcoceras hygrometricum]|nr:hypothetical protein F511_01150 [Dorcoceras hygrometricum]
MKRAQIHKACRRIKCEGTQSKTIPQPFQKAYQRLEICVQREKSAQGYLHEEDEHYWRQRKIKNIGKKTERTAFTEALPRKGNHPLYLMATPIITTGSRDHASLNDISNRLEDTNILESRDDDLQVRRPSEVIQADADRVQADVDRVQADADNMETDADHVQTDADLVQADADHTQADADHTQADAYLVQDEAEHTQADEDIVHADTDQVQVDADLVQDDADLEHADVDCGQGDPDRMPTDADHTQADADRTLVNDPNKSVINLDDEDEENYST